MILLSYLFVAFVCVSMLCFVVAELSKRNLKSKLHSTDTSYLETRQVLIEALEAPSAPIKTKPVSNLRGVKNKRFRKK